MARKQTMGSTAKEVEKSKRGKTDALTDSKNTRKSRSVPPKDAKETARPARQTSKRSVSAVSARPKTEERPAKRARSQSARPKKTEKTQPKKVAAKETKVEKPARVTKPKTEAKPKNGPAAQKLSRGVKRPSVEEEEAETAKKAKVFKAKKEEEIVEKRLHLPASRHARGSGVALACGQNDCGQLGMSQDVEQRKRPQKIPGVGEVLDVAAGGLHSVVLTVKGEVYTFGNNDEGALGRVTEEEEDRFEAGKVELPGRAFMVSAGDAHSAALLDDGRVFVWGIFKSASGDLGLVSNIKGKVEKPVQILPDVLFVKIVSGENHMALLSETGHVYTFGCPEQGQLGRMGERTAVIGSGRRGLSDYLEPKEVTLKKKRLVFSDVWAGGMATFLKVKDSGEIYVCGLNNYGQIAPDTKEDRVVKYYPELNNALPAGTVAIAGGQHHTLALVDGKVLSFGSSTYGRLGTGDLGPEKPVQAEPTQVKLDDKKVIDIAVGTAVSFALSSEGESFSWGMGTNGQLGSGSEDDLFTPYHIQSKETQGKKIISISSGGQHTLFVVEGETSAQKTEPVVNKQNGAAPAPAAEVTPKEAPILSGEMADSESSAVDEAATGHADSDLSDSVFSR